MSSLTGTKTLLKLAIRLDRIKISIWIIAIVGLIALTLPQLKTAYGSEQQVLLYAQTTSSSPVTRLLGGALTGPSMGEITIIETYVLAVVLVALMNIFLITRNTRQSEETGRAEIIGSMKVGRQSAITAALLLAIGINIIVSILIAIVYISNGFAVDGTAAYSIGIGLAGITFAAIAAVTSQLFENTRAASGLAGLILGTQFMLRGIADILGTLRHDGLGVVTSNLSWVTPLG